MADVTKPDVKEQVKIAQGRSPAYPYISLGDAVKRAEQVRDAGAARADMPPETFYRIWEIGALSSGARQTMAALNHFGLVEYVGRGDDRKVKLSDLALKIVLDRQPNSPERTIALAKAALAPPIHADLYERYKTFLPADVVLQTYLTRDRGFNDQAAANVIDEWKATLAFSGLSEPLKMPEQGNGEAEGDDASKSKIEVGDLVNVERDGILVFPKPVLVREIQEHDGQTWVWTDGANSWTEMETVELVTKGTGAPRAAAPPPPLTPEAAATTRRTEELTRTLMGVCAPGTRREVFALDEGDVVLTFPENLSPESYADLASYFELFLRKAKRRAETDRQAVS